MRARSSVAFAFGISLVAVPLLGACESIAGYDDAQPWPAESGADESDATASDAPSAREDHDLPTSIDSGPPSSIADAASEADSGVDAQSMHDTGADSAMPIDAQVEASIDAGIDTGSDATPDASGDAGACPILTGGEICSQVPHFNAAAQVIDAIGDEFCDVPATIYQVETAAYKQRAVPGTTYPEVVTYRIAWSTYGLHVHVHVDDPKLLIAPGNDLYSGDAVVIYSAGGPSLSGAFNGTNDDGAVQVLISPASGSQAARAYAFYWDGAARTSSFDSSLYASRIVPGGYEVEAKIPWSAQKDPNSIKSGGAIAIDPGVIVKDNPAFTGQELESTIGFRPLTSGATTTCASGTFSPWCDDRTWCLSTLQ